MSQALGSAFKQTTLYKQHVALGGNMVDFAGWQMPLHYGSQLEEHYQVRNNVGMFDVSHMGVVDIKGIDATTYLRKLLANDVNKITNSKALYSCMLNENGGVIDDLIAYKLQDDFYRLVINAGTTEKDLNWLQQNKQNFNIEIIYRQDLSILAIQGPRAREYFAKTLPEQLQKKVNLLKSFECFECDAFFVGVTGYTGESGIEVIAPHQYIQSLFLALRDLGVPPIGLGARDSLRLEAGFNLYGNDMDETTSPYESRLGWTVDLKDDKREFIGKAILLAQKETGVSKRLVLIRLEGKGILRRDMQVSLSENKSENVKGIITSGGYSPTLGCSVGFARVPSMVSDKVFVLMRGKWVIAEVVKSFLEK